MATFKSAALLSTVVETENEVLFYLDFFRKAGAKAYDLNRLFLENDAKIAYCEPNAVMFTVHEDDWIVEIDGEDGLVLYHNNYIVNKDLSRTFTGGFHEQDVYGIQDFGFFARKMIRYSWAEHQEILRQYNEEMRASKLRTLLAVADNFVQEPSDSRKYSCFTFAYYSDDCKKLAKEYGINIEIIERYPPNSKSFSVIGCRVYKSQEREFIAMMKSIKDRCPENLIQDYLNLCEENIPQIG